MKFEYMTAEVDEYGCYVATREKNNEGEWRDVLKGIDDLGKNGWELINVIQLKDGELRGWFKRQVDEYGIRPAGRLVG